MTLLESVIGWVAPPLCIGCGQEGHALCGICQASEIIEFGARCFNCHKLSADSKTCEKCRRKLALRSVWISTDYDKTARALILRLKIQHDRSAARDIAAMMATTYRRFNNRQRQAAKNYLIVPVPTASVRVRQRSFDHTALIARLLSRELGIPTAAVVGRLGETKQVGATKQARTAQAKGSYLIRKESIVSGRDILLIDDVITTGATVGEVAKVLRRAGAKSVDGLAFAKSL